MNDQNRSVLAVILARGGSKGVPGKNLKLVGGKTLLARGVTTAGQATTVARTVVSTDSAEIAEEAVRYGASVVTRPAPLAGDTASSEEALLHAVQVVQAEPDSHFDAVALLQVTSPFTRPQDIDRAMFPILHGDADSTLTVVDDYGYFWFQGDDGWSMNYQIRGRRQDRGPWKRESGNVYGIRIDLFLKTRQLFQGRVQPVTIPNESFLEIDDPHELATAEALHAYYDGKARSGGDRPQFVAQPAS